MKPIKVTLGDTDDRVVELYITDKDGRTYRVGIEVLAHHFGPASDELQVCVSKVITPDHHESPNAVCVNENRVARRPRMTHSAWFEFHELDGLPSV